MLSSGSMERQGRAESRPARCWPSPRPLRLRLPARPRARARRRRAGARRHRQDRVPPAERLRQRDALACDNLVVFFGSWMRPGQEIYLDAGPRLPRLDRCRPGRSRELAARGGAPPRAGLRPPPRGHVFGRGDGRAAPRGRPGPHPVRLARERPRRAASSTSTTTGSAATRARAAHRAADLPEPALELAQAGGLRARPGRRRSAARRAGGPRRPRTAASPAARTPRPGGCPPSSGGSPCRPAAR